MINNKKICVLLVAVIMLFATTSCGKDQSEFHVMDESDTQPLYLSLFSPTSMSESDVTKYWVERFTEQYNREVYIEFDGATYYGDEGLSYRELLARRLESSTPDDLYVINAEDVMEFEKKGYWMDLSNMDFVNNLSDASLYQSTYKGKVFSLPLTFTGFGFMWNVDLLAKYSLDIPQNLTEFLNVCETLKTNGVLPYGSNKGFGLTVPAMCVGFSELYRSGNVDERIADLNSGKTPVSDYLSNGFSFLSTMIEKGYLDPKQALNSEPNGEDLDLFLAGECAFICTTFGQFKSGEDQPFTMKLTGLPVLSDSCTAVYGAQTRLCVNPKSKHMDTALKFIEMVGSFESLEKSAEIHDSMSSSKSIDVARSPMVEEFVSLLQQPGHIPNQDFALNFNTWESIRDVSRELCGGISVDQACDMLDKKQRTDLESYSQQ